MLCLLHSTKEFILRVIQYGSKNIAFFVEGEWVSGLLLKLINPTQIILLKFNKYPFENGIENHSMQKCREVTNAQFPP